MNHTQTLIVVIAGTVLAGLWLWFVLWIHWMAYRVLRWVYREKKEAWEIRNRRYWSPPAP